MTDFFIKVRAQLEQQLPFVIYSKPGSKIMSGVFQHNDHLYFADKFCGSGFVMAPFSGTATILFPESESEAINVVSRDIKPTETAINIRTDLDEKRIFTSMVEKAKSEIEGGVFAKVVVSRREQVEIPDFDIETAYGNLIRNYPDAFTYCWFHPKVGMWLGATPEQLVRSDGKKFYSVALAGTRKIAASDDGWAQKENEEQQFVTDYILENLQHVASEITVSSPYTARAGNLFHIKTDIEGVFNNDSTLDEVLAILHPTPAVCGVPKIHALDFIFTNETFDREYYTGFLGELNKENSGESDLYVNLRCMQYKDGIAYLYAGCGITKDSDPEKEYEETANKLLTIKKIL